MKSSIIAQHKPMETGLSTKTVQAWLVAYLAKHLKVSPESIDPFDSFYGHIIGGFQSSGMAADLENWLGVKLSSSIFYRHPDIATLSHHIVKEKLRSDEHNNSSSKLQLHNQIPELINKASRIFRY